MEYLKRYVRVGFPGLHEKIYFVPAVHFNRVQYDIIKTESVDIKVQTPSPQLSDVREDEAHQRVLHSLKRLFELLGEVMVVISSLDFDTYLNNLGALINTASNTDPGQSPRGAKAPKLSTTDVNSLGYSATGTVNSTGGSMHKGVKQRHKVLLQNGHKNRHKVHFVRPRDLSTDLNRGTFDVLMITKNHGMVVIEIKAIGDAFGLNLPGTGSVNEGESIRTKIQKAVKQLVKETKVLRHLTEDLDPKLSITRSLILPNLKRKTLEEALSQDQELTKAVCECMEEANLSDALSRCLFTDHLPPIGRHWDIHEHVTKVLQDWWNLLVGRQRGQPMSDHVYESLVARFCGPATPLRVNTAYRQKAEVSTLPDAVLETAHCYREWALTSDQVNILRKDSDSRVYLTGPSGTGKTTMLALRALRWLRRGHDVYFISLWTGCEAASRLLCRLIQDRLPSDTQRQRVKLLSNTTGKFEDIVNKILCRSEENTRVLSLRYMFTDTDDSSRDVEITMNDMPSSDEKKTVDNTLPKTTTEEEMEDNPMPRKTNQEDGDAKVFTECAKVIGPTAADVSPMAFCALGSPSSLRSHEQDELAGGVVFNYEEKMEVDAVTEISSLPEDAMQGTQQDISSEDDRLNPFVHAATGTVYSTDGCVHEGVKPTGETAADKSSVSADPPIASASTFGQPGSSGEPAFSKPVLPTTSQTVFLGPRTVYVICDEVPWFFSTFVQLLDSKKPLDCDLRIWAASQFHGTRPESFKEVKLTQCLHCPPVVTREIEKGSAYRTRATYHYATGDSAFLSSLPPPTDGPSVMRVSHDSHRTEKVWDCIECGTAVAEKLKELKVGVEDGIKYSDVLISGYDFPSEVTEKQTYANDAVTCEDTDGRKDTVTPKILCIRDRPASTSDSTEHKQLHGFLKGIVSQDFPVGVFRISDRKCNFAEELSSRTVNQIQVAEPQCILGLKWTVVVAIGANDLSATYPRYVDPWCDVIARCLSQLIVVGDLDGSL